MIISRVTHFIQHKFRVNSSLTLLITLFMIWGCNQNKDFIKLDAPLEDILPKIILIAPKNNDDIEKNIEITVGEEYSGEGEYPISEIELHKFTYELHNEYVAEGNRYIYVIVAYNWGGSGTFYYLTAVDKTTLKSVDEVFLDDRIKVNDLELTTPWSDSVSLTYLVRSSNVPMAAPPDKKVNMKYRMSESKLIKDIESSK
ncbi:hypothetical protein JT359_17570 [Candidatus Poribacteria bacterium]|nr:hypothetical protein [Candidatus Poribacteria bacterium]